jgi:hypothetical protein
MLFIKDGLVEWNDTKKWFLLSLSEDSLQAQLFIQMLR